MAVLELFEGKKPIMSFHLTEDIVTIGRSGDNHIVLPDKKLRVSRYHAVLLRSLDYPNQYVIRDLSSWLGTKVKGRYIFQKLLAFEDDICIGDFILRYKTYDAEGSCFSEEAVYPSFPSYVGEGPTEVLNPKEISSLKLSEKTKLLIEEFLDQTRKIKDCKQFLKSALESLFKILDLGKNCFGAFYILERESMPELAATKGSKIRTPSSPSHSVINGIKPGRCLVFGNLIWSPLLSRKGNLLGILYLSKGVYDPHFKEHEVDLIFSLCKEIGNVLEDKVFVFDSGDYAEEFFQWPRKMIGNFDILEDLEKVAKRNTTVLILGETGVGKEVIAEYLHACSDRNRQILRKVNCPAIPNQLLESELFGHKKGAFTDAKEDKKGEFELADGGTIFLDEIGDLSWDLQRKILRVIQEKEIKRLGEEKSRKVDVRIIAATNRDLEMDMDEGKFGRDLYFRFEEKIHLLPLRERKREIALLAHFFLDEFSKEMKVQSRGITPQAMRCLLSYQWPGNVRELKDCIRSALAKSNGVIFYHHLPLQIQDLSPVDDMSLDEGIPRSLDEVEMFHIKEVLHYTRGNKEKAASILGISKQTLYNKIEKYNLNI